MRMLLGLNERKVIPVRGIGGGASMKLGGTKQGHSTFGETSDSGCAVLQATSRLNANEALG